MSIKIKGGTKPDKRLCDSCRHGTVRRGARQSEELVYCSLLPVAQAYPGFGFSLVRGNLPFPVVECSEYENKISLSKYDMERIGWVLEMRGTAIIGFKPPKKEINE